MTKKRAVPVLKHRHDANQSRLRRRQQWLDRNVDVRREGEY